MFYKHERLLKKLRAEGRAAQAEVLHVRLEGSGSSGRRAEDFDITQSWYDYRLELRVKPAGEPAFDAVVKTRLYWARNPGEVVDVLYDPDDHDKIVVDYEAEGRKDMERQRSIAQAPDRIAASTERLAEVREQLAQRLAARAESRGDELGQLERLADLRARGVLSEDEFQAQKRRILGT
jgi:hypothetical protein